MSADVEQAAEECSQKWVITAIKPIGQPAYDLPSDVIKDIKYRLKQAFLSGHSFALTPRKIDWSKPATQPPLKTPVLCFVSNQKEKYWYVGFRENVGGDSVMRMTIWGNTAPMPDYYLPLPPTPQGER